MTEILDGKKTAEEIQEGLAERIERLQTEKGIRPGLAVVLVGEDPASAIYVRMKSKRAAKLGMHSEVLKFPATTTKDELHKAIDGLNLNSDIHGILVQLPLPDHLDPHETIDWIMPAKDVDGLTAISQGLLYRGQPCLAPCTPKGMLRLLDVYGITTEGKNVVVVGRSELVGRPLAVMLSSRKRNATVTVAHTRTRNLGEITKKADIVAIAAGKAHMLNASHFSEGVVVIDAGTNTIPCPEAKNGQKLVGDVDYESVSKLASYITPVPGGVGPMTVCMLLENTFEAALMASEG
ncbi:MAG: bifunctional methylenetetrahydrofolate dehydrogenase/methenyltetrahydrofolate cyclohydrolase FolD [Candidatus Coatesbacteria bacterium]|nr:bifunctional methylenetetrahydrofolate dehydrogenase/methenyltetrahydrofolate cyclohydrolase FolD [Candidatus Coatesbacteria bacterium]